MDNLTETERIRRDRLAVLVADALSKRAGNTVTGPLTLTASRVVDELLKDPWVLLDALDAVSRDHQRAEYKVRMSYLARAERAETELDEEREHRGRKEAQLLGAAMENKNLRADNEQLRKAIDAVLVRCRTGSQHSNWLPIIDSILSEALSGGPVGPSQSWHEQPPPAMDDDTKTQLRDRAERDEAAWESQNPPPPHGADAEPSRCTTCGQPQDYPGCLCMMEPYVDENDVPDQTVYEWWDKADPVQVEGGVCIKCGSGVLNSGEHIRTDLPPCYEDEDCSCDTAQYGGLHSRYCESKAPSHNRWCSPCGYIVSECRCESYQPKETKPSESCTHESWKKFGGWASCSDCDHGWAVPMGPRMCGAIPPTSDHTAPCEKTAGHVGAHRRTYNDGTAWTWRDSDQCECGHVLQRVGEDRLLRCVMGCSYQAKRDADNDSPEDRMVVLRRHPDGTPSVWCDPEIADIVQALNAGGVPTVASCSGHGNRPGNVALTDGRELIIAANWAEAREVESAFPPFTNPNDDHNGRDQAVEAATDAIANHILTNWYEDISPSEGQPEHAFVWNNAPRVAEEVVDAIWDRVQALEAALPDPDKLERLADWFDLNDTSCFSNEVQRDLRTWARRARAVMGED